MARQGNVEVVDRTGQEPRFAGILEFMNDGLLALVNMAVLWPRGLAIQVDVGLDGDVIDVGIWNAGEPIAVALDAETAFMDRMFSLLDFDRKEGE